jgi:Ca2+-binding EF-hand superfamily protein
MGVSAFDEEEWERRPAVGKPSMKGKGNGKDKGQIGMKHKGPAVHIDMSDMVLKKFRDCLSHRYGPNSVNKLQNLFILARGSHGRDNMGSLKNFTLEEMHHVLDLFGLHLTDDGLHILMKAIDPNDDGVSEEELIEAVRGPVSQSRQKIIGLVFDKLDASKSGTITHEDMAAYYNVDWDPDVRSNNVPQGISPLENFFNQYDNDHDGLVTRSEFVKYYANMSHAYENDEAFELMLVNAWHLTGIMKAGNEMNTSNLRAEVVFADGNQKVITVDDDIGLRRKGHVDTALLKKRLEKQGLKNIQSVSLGYASQ